jgi:hypothetical protein
VSTIHHTCPHTNIIQHNLWADSKPPEQN